MERIGQLVGADVGERGVVNVVDDGEVVVNEGVACGENAANQQRVGGGGGEGGAIKRPRQGVLNNGVGA